MLRHSAVFGGPHHGDSFVTEGMKANLKALEKGGVLRVMRKGKTKRDKDSGAVRTRSPLAL